ncbi:PEP/pyruvate-binding domain-containing protein [Dechloromonas sp. ZY10]|uniref:PEP/pyruvate-binding domain-containing protein n=1 Tax=Dechloromonas aquae TaxID=2664436 RepID=UPI003527926E
MSERCSDALALYDAARAARAAAAEVGGKGRQLGILRERGLPVPDFFVIPAAWSRLAAPGGGQSLAGTASATGGATGGATNSAEAGVPPALVDLLHAELAARGWLQTPLAVRSSAVGEDAAAASFAGIFVSRLNICGLPALTVAVGEVWASLQAPAAVAYRQGLRLAGDTAMAVVVMPLLPAVAAGIGFTCDPRSGREDRIVVHANWGLGETLVGGECAGDEYLFAEDTTDVWRLLASRPGAKPLQALPAPGGGTERRPVAAGQVTAPVLNTAQAEALAALLRDAAVACDFVAPFYDLEWVWDGAQFWLTQARPVTRRPHYTYAALRTQPAIWTRGNTCEVMPEPLQAMDWNFSRHGCNDLLEQGWKLAGATLLPGIQRAGLIDGRLYLEAAILQWEAWDGIGLLPARFNALMGGHQPCIATTPPSWRQRLQRSGRLLTYLRRAPAFARRGDAEVATALAIARELRARTLPAETDAIVALLQRLLQPAREFVGMFFLQGSGGGSLNLLLDTLERLFPGEGAALGAALLADGEPSVTAQQGYALLALAQQAKKCLRHGRPWPQDENGLPATQAEAWQAWLADPEFAAALAAFLDTYGHRGHYETYLRSPRWAEAPALLLAQLPALAEVDAGALRARQQAAAAAAWARVRREAPFWARGLIRAQVKAATRDSNRREAARSALIALLAAGRRLWLQIGARLVGEGVLATADDIFHLLPAEIERYARGLLPAHGVQARLAERQARFAEWQATTPEEWRALAPADDFSPLPRSTVNPAQNAAGCSPLAVAAGIGEPIPSVSAGLAAVAPPRHSGQAAKADVWRGVATGTGVVRGRVRRLRHPAEGLALQPGEILVAPSTDPGWTPLFLKAGGLVVETGGYLSHAAIVAREFALPAVINLPGILAALADGEEVEVDGLRGEVRRL